MPRISRLAGILVDRIDGTDRHYWVHFDTPAWDATLAWCRFHGLDPCSIPAGTPVIRDEQAHVIAYTVMVRDADGRIMHDDGAARFEDRTERGEAGPLPFPPEVLALTPVPRRP